MKKYVILAMAALMVCLLTACGCNHEWKEADCLNPKTCTLCEETEGEALGHSWAEADCEAAKNCTNCGETEGEALGHSWSEWEAVDNENEEHKCNTCGAAETRTIDWKAMAQELVEGTWAGFAITMNGGTYTLEGMAYTMSFDDAGNVTVNMPDMGIIYTAPWEYYGYINDGEKAYHSLGVWLAETSAQAVPCMVWEMGDGVPYTDVVLVLNDDMWIYYDRIQNVVEDSEEYDARVIGTWEASTQYVNGEKTAISPVTMVMEEDHSLIVTQDGESREGAWWFDKPNTDFIPDTVVYQYFLKLNDSGDTYTVILYEHGLMQVLGMFGGGDLTNFEKVG